VQLSATDCTPRPQVTRTQGDEFTGTTPNADWDYGKLNVDEAVAAAGTVAGPLVGPGPERCDMTFSPLAWVRG